MSITLITCCVLFLAAFCVLAYVIEHWSFWKSTGPRRWGWIQSWSKKPKSNKIRYEDIFDTDFVQKLDRKISEMKETGINFLKEIDKNCNQAYQLYNDGWRTAGGIDQSGRRILVRGESHAYVSLEVWTEVERLTKAKWDELHGKPIPKYPLGTDSSPERPIHKTTNNPILFAKELYEKGWTCGGGIDPETRHRVVYKDGQFVYVQLETWTELSRIWRQNSYIEGPAVVGEKGPETITVNGSTLYVPGGILDWSKIPPASSSNVDWKQFGIDKRMDGFNIKDRTQVTEVNEVPEMPMEQVVSPSGKVYNWPDVRHPDFKISPMIDVFAKISEVAQKVVWTIRIAELKRRRFLPSVNPLGDTGAYMKKYSMDWSDCRIISFRHKKGGRRG